MRTLLAKKYCILKLQHATSQLKDDKSLLSMLFK